ncbi:twin-arginine translocation signal domain-containing protein, partial [Streptomyces sp. SID5789]|nr:twin-arginine translocation signal domain-containing protein [Streptomyces sp. SID5789]
MTSRHRSSEKPVPSPAEPAGARTPSRRTVVKAAAAGAVLAAP